MRKVKKYTKGNFLSVFIKMLERFVCVFSVVVICPNQGTITTTYRNVALLQDAKFRHTHSPICRTIFQLGKNNLDRFWDPDGCFRYRQDPPDANFALHAINGNCLIFARENWPDFLTVKFG